MLSYLLARSKVSGMLGIRCELILSLVDALFGPPMEIDSWAMWMVHRTRLGAVLYRAFWKWVQGLGVSLLSR